MKKQKMNVVSRARRRGGRSLYARMEGLRLAIRLAGDVPGRLPGGSSIRLSELPIEEFRAMVIAECQRPLERFEAPPQFRAKRKK